MKNLENSQEFLSQEGSYEPWEAKRRAQLPEWRQRVIECRSSGLSVREWCAEQQISTKTYYRWEREVLDLAGRQLARQDAPSQEVGVVTFTELPPPQKQPASSGSGMLIGGNLHGRRTKP